VGANCRCYAIQRNAMQTIAKGDTEPSNEVPCAIVTELQSILAFNYDMIFREAWHLTMKPSQELRSYLDFLISIEKDVGVKVTRN